MMGKSTTTYNERIRNQHIEKLNGKLKFTIQVFQIHKWLTLDKWKVPY